MSTGCPRSVPRSGVLSRLSLQNYSADTSSPVIGRYRSVTPDLTCNCEYSQLLSSPPSPLVRFSPYRRKVSTGKSPRRAFVSGLHVTTFLHIGGGFLRPLL